jgi:superfamily II DNA/RNA helicase
LPDQTFAGLGVSSPVVSGLMARGIREPFAIQRLVLRDALAGRDVLAKSPTGSGKTLAFGIPLIERLEPAGRPTALVLAPTRELASQIADELRPLAQRRRLRVATVYGGVGLPGQARTAARADILVATPGRLDDLVLRGMVSLDGIGIFVLDEADQLLDLGFQPQVDRIVARLPRERQTMFFSATLDGRVGELAARYTREPASFEAELPPRDIGEVEHRFVPVTPESKLDALVEELGAERGLTLVFVRTKRGASRLAEKLDRAGVDAVAMHGDLSQAQRERALARFASGRASTLVATDVAARGLDVDDITHVVNFDPPADEKAYVHRVGRTGRAGRSGTGVTLVLADQQRDVGLIARTLDLEAAFTAGGMTIVRPGQPTQRRRGNRPRTHVPGGATHRPLTAPAGHRPAASPQERGPSGEQRAPQHQPSPWGRGGKRRRQRRA